MPALYMNEQIWFNKENQLRRFELQLAGAIQILLKRGWKRLEARQQLGLVFVSGRRRSPKMKNQLGKVLYRRRTDLGLNFAQLAEKVGYRNITKGINRLVDLEREGKGDRELLEKTIAALELDRDVVRQAIDEDRAEYEAMFERWVNEPIEPYLVRRAVAAVYLKRRIPEELLERNDPDELERYASRMAAEWRSKVCLVKSRRECTWVDEQGMIYLRTNATPAMPMMGPVMWLKGRQRPAFLLEIG